MREIKNSGITLIALVVTIIVLLILAGISIMMLTGNNGILTNAANAKQKTRGAEVNEMVKLETTNAAITDYTRGKPKSKDELISELHSQGKLTQEEVNELETSDTITIDGITIDFSALSTLAAVYTDEMIGQKITYSSNGQSNWIVFGKDENGNILITTEKPIDNVFSLKDGPESWLKYESDTDTTYGLNYACSGYGGTVQGVNVTSRSIKMKDINNVIGLKPKAVTVDGKTYNIQSFDSYTFGTTLDYNNKKVNAWYPILSGGTSKTGTGTGFWKAPNKENEMTLENNWFEYYWNYSEDKCYYAGVETDDKTTTGIIEDIELSTIGVNMDNLIYVWGGATAETYFNPYLIADKAAMIKETYTDYRVGCVIDWHVDSYYCCLTNSNTKTDSGQQIDLNFYGQNKFGIRPVVTLPAKLKVEKNPEGKYDLAQ